MAVRHTTYITVTKHMSEDLGLYRGETNRETGSRDILIDAIKSIISTKQCAQKAT